MVCGRPLTDPPALLIVPFSINFVFDGAHGLPFGGYRIAPTADDTDRGYTGHLHTDGIGLIYMNARFYSPAVGRFASAEIIIPDPGSSQGFNRYSYVENRPVNFNDPTGHYGICFQGGRGEEVDSDSVVQELCTNLHADELLGKDFQVFANDADDIEAALAKIMTILEGDPDEPVQIVGYSWGGGAALEFANLLADEGIEVETLVFIDPVVEGRSSLGRAAVDVRETRTESIFGFEVKLSAFWGGFDVSIPENVKDAYNFYASDNDLWLFEGESEINNALNIEVEDTNHNSIMNATCSQGPLACTSSRISGSFSGSSSPSSGGSNLNNSTFELIRAYLQ